MAKARHVLRKLKKLGQPMIVFAFHNNVEIGPPALAKLAKQAGCKIEDLS